MTKMRQFCGLLTTALGLLLAAPALAQDPVARDTALPNLTPQEVEIRGQLEIAFPSLERQPLVGFNPPPRIMDIPETRTPYVEPYKQENADLPASPLNRPEAPAASGLAGGTVRNGSFETGLGRYLSRFVEAQTGVPLGAHETFSGRLMYEGSNGHTPFEDEPDVKAPYDAFEGEVGLSTRRGAVAAGAELDGFYNSYTLFGAEPAGNTADVNPQPPREGGGFGGGGWLRTRADLPVAAELRVHYSGTRYETDVFRTQTPDDDAFTRTEQRFDGSGTLEAPLSSQGYQAILADARFSTAGLDGVSAFSSSTWLFDGGAGFRFRLGRSADLTVGGRVASFDVGGSSTAPAANGDVKATYFAPDVRLELYPRVGTRLYLQNRPAAEANTLADLYRLNPYLIDKPDMQPSVRTVDAEGGASVFVGAVQLAARGGYRYFPNYLFFEDRAAAAAPGGYVRGLSAAGYDEARIWHVGGEVSFMLTAGVHATLGATYRDGELSEGTLIPYFGHVVGQGMLSFAFAGSRGLLQLTGAYESGRYRDREGSRKIGDYFDLDFAASYNVTQTLGLVLRIDNISSASRLERWDHYQEAPLVAQGGLRVQW